MRPFLILAQATRSAGKIGAKETAERAAVRKSPDVPAAASAECGDGN
jgi:hypothetical protein